MYGYFEKLIDPYPPEEPGMAPAGLAAFVYHYTRPVLPWLAVTSLLTAAIAVVEIVFFSFLGSLVDWLTAADRATFYAEHGMELLAMAALLVVGFPLLTLAHGLLFFQTTLGNYPMIVRWRAHRYLLRQSLEFFQDEFAGRVSQKVMQTALAVRETTTKLMDIGVYVIVFFAGTVYLTGAADPLLIVPLAVWLAAYVGILVFFLPKLRRISMKQADARAEMTGRVVDSYTNIQTIKLFAHTRREHTYARDAMDGFLRTVYPQMRLVTALTVSLHVVNSLLLAGVAALAIYGWQRSLVTLGSIAVAIGLIMRLRAMSQWIVWEVADLFENVGTIQDGINTIARPVTIADREGAVPLRVDRGEIRFAGARFHYGRTARVIEDFSLIVKPGEKVGIVGRSGAGKSTIVHLLLRFYDLEDGCILIDGQDIVGVTQDSLRRQIGMVTQDTSLLHRSVCDNILYGRPEATEAEVMEAARLARADTFIANLADAKGRTAYDAHVGERGVKLSGGQRQRIAIARVFLKDAPILVLDEATSALDSEVEAAIQESLYRLMAGKTVIAIAHRLSTIAAMDRLVVLDRGRIVEIGSHEELLRHEGLYAALWRHQSGGFLDVASAAEAAE